MARVPYANVNLVKLPDEVTDDQAILLSDIFPTGYFGAELADIEPGHTIASSLLMSAGRVFAIDCISSRLEMAKNQGAEVINFDEEDPIEAIRRLTGGIGVDRVIDAVGIDAVCPHAGPTAKITKNQRALFQEEVKKIAPKQNPKNGNWEPGDAPSQALRWAVECLAKAGTLSIIGVYPETAEAFPIGKAMNKNLTIRMGNCNHRKYIPTLIEMIQEGIFDPSKILTEIKPLTDAIEAYKAFERREAGWIKVELKPSEKQPSLA